MATMNGIWSPLGEQEQQQQQQLLQESLFASPFVQRIRQCEEDEQKTRGSLMWRIQEIEEEAKAYIQADNIKRLGKLTLQLQEICQQGRAAQAALQAAKDNEIVERNGDAARNNRYNNAARSLRNAKDKALPSFYSDRDVAAKGAAIEKAQSELNKVLAEMQAHPMSIPIAVQAVRQAESRVTELANKEAALRSKIANLSGQQSQPTGAADNGLGLR